MQFYDGNIFFSGWLLRFYESCRSSDTNDQTTGHFWVQSARMASFVDFKNSANPSDNLVTGRIGRFVDIDHARRNIVRNVTLKDSG